MMTSGSLAVSAHSTPAFLSSGKSSFSRGEIGVESSRGTGNHAASRTNVEEFGSIAIPNCALKIKKSPSKTPPEAGSNAIRSAPSLIVEQAATIVEQASMIAMEATGTLPKSSAALPRVKTAALEQASMIAMEATGALPKSSAALPRVKTAAVKALNKPGRIQAAMQRVFTSRDVSTAVANVAESFLTLLEPDDHPYYGNLGVQLVDNFAPVSQECPPTSGLKVTGTIPSCLDGIYLRNGSNPQFIPTGAYHVFDGDGMLHAVRIKDGVPSYCCRFTQTAKYLQERKAGHSLYPNVMGELTGWNGLARLALFTLRNSLGIVNKSEGTGAANAGLAFHNGNLLAMSEDDMPYVIDISPDGDLRTLGRRDVSCGKHGIQFVSMTAHPKVDPITGEMFSYSYSVIEKPHVHYWRASADGEMSPPVAINDIKEAVLLHDFAITERYAVIPDPIMVFRIDEMIAGRTPVLLDDKKMTRFGVLPKNATDDSAIKWFDAPGSSCFHYLNAWEEGDDVVLMGSTTSPPARAFTDMALLFCYLTEYRLNMKTGKSSIRRFSDMNVDMGRINERFMGKKTRYVYMSMAGPWPKFSGIVKVDLEAAAAGDTTPEVGVRKFPPGCFGSEPFFVPRTDSVEAESEDDGYVVTFLHNEYTNVSELAILDARSPTLEPVATIQLPARVPYGFHGIFLNEKQLASQKSWYE